MKTKFEKKLRLIAAGIFLLGLMANVTLSFTDPFLYVSTTMLSQTGSGSGSSSSSSVPCTTTVSLKITEYGFYCSSQRVNMATRGNYNASCNSGDSGACEDSNGKWSATYNSTTCAKQTETFPASTITYCDHY